MTTATVTQFPDSDINIDRIRTHIADLIQAGDVSQAEVSRQSGVPSSTLSSFLSNSYTGRNDAVATKLNKYLQQREQKAAAAREMPKSPDFIDTPTARRVLTACSYAQMAGDIACLYSGAGLGKTTALREYAKRSPNVWLVTATKSMTSVTSCLLGVARGLGMRNPPKRAWLLELEIADRLRDTGGLLIIDEAQKLNLDQLEALRDLHDETGVGLVLCGNEIVYSRLTGGSRGVEFAQLFSRIGKRCRFNRPSQGDITALLDAWDIEDAAARKTLAAIAAKPGALRGVTKCIRLATLFAAGATPNKAHIDAAWKDLTGDAS